MAKPIRNITRESFSSYGTVIEHPGPGGGEGFLVLLRESEPVGWRIAVNRIENRTVSKLARHPSSMESFEPVEGVTLLCLAAPDAPDDWELFLLDRPVCLHKNVWHATLCLSGHSVVKICENLEVDSEDHAMPGEVGVLAGP